jgi:hypothetical protein
MMKRIDEFFNWLVFLTLIALGVGMMLYSAHYAVLTVRSAGWTEASGVVAFSYAGGGVKKGNSRFTPKVVYQYSVDGVNYTGTTLSHEFSSIFFGTDREAAEAKLAAFQSGAAVRVFYDPAAPEYSCLVKGGSPAGYIYPLALGIGFAGLGIAGLYRRLKT